MKTSSSLPSARADVVDLDAVSRAPFGNERAAEPATPTIGSGLLEASVMSASAQAETRGSVTSSPGVAPETQDWLRGGRQVEG